MVFTKDPDLKRRLDVTKMETMFKRHLQEAFGDRHIEFTPQLRDRLVLELKTAYKYSASQRKLKPIKEPTVLALRSSLKPKSEMAASGRKRPLKVAVFDLIE